MCRNPYVFVSEAPWEIANCTIALNHSSTDSCIFSTALHSCSPAVTITLLHYITLLPQTNYVYLIFAISITYYTYQHVLQPCVVFLLASCRKDAEGRCRYWTCRDSFLRCKVRLNVGESYCLDSESIPTALPVGFNEAECTHEGESTHQHTLTADLIFPLWTNENALLYANLVDLSSELFRIQNGRPSTLCNEAITTK